MRPEATGLAEAQRCETCVVMLEDVDEVWETMRIEEEPPIDDGKLSNLSKHLLNLKVRPTSKASKLHTTLYSTSTTN